VEETALPKAEVVMLSKRRDVLMRELNAAMPSVHRQRLAELTDLFARDSLTAYAALTPREKSAFWRIILSDHNGKIRPVEMVRVKKGNSQKSLGRWAVVNSPLSWNAVDADAASVGMGDARVRHAAARSGG
jgi:hypothetical protein